MKLADFAVPYLKALSDIGIMTKLHEVRVSSSVGQKLFFRDPGASRAQKDPELT